MVTPRLMTEDEAAAYVRLKVPAFRRLRLGVVTMGTDVRYDRVAIDRHLDALAGLPSPLPPHSSDNDPEAAFDRSRPVLGNASRTA